jgi:hypothetical protein
MSEVGGLTNFRLVLTDDKPVVIDGDMRGTHALFKKYAGATRKNAGLVLNTHHSTIPRITAITPAGAQARSPPISLVRRWSGN